MVWHEIQKQLHTSLRQLSPGDGETLGTSEVFVCHITPYAVWRTNIVFWLEVGQSSMKVIKQTLILIGNGDARRTPFPHSHKPDGIKSAFGDGVPLG
jgi:hypothetical protein